MLDYLTVNETSQDNQPMDDDTVNGVRSLMEENVIVNNSWLYQSYQKDKMIKLSEPNPFLEHEGQVAINVGYIYKIWKLGPHRRICIRSTIHGYIPKDS